VLFNSLSFALFFPIVYVVYRGLSPRRQNIFLLAASYVFYGSWDWRFLSLILVSTVVDYGVALRLHRSDAPRTRKRLLWLSVGTNLGLLGVFKYFGFFADSLRDALGAMGVTVDVPTLQVVLPVGISFYTFQTLSYTIDVYRRQLEPTRDPIDFALFVAFFPQLVAGPIERASRMLPQIARRRDIDADDLRIGLWYILLGYFLKVFVADNLAPIADAGFSPEGTGDGLTALLGVYAFAFQIFGDFAGYSWIAIGTARVMGFHLTLNFRAPYLVTNPRDFWRHWHISLSTWLRDYLYIPLGGGRGTRLRVYRNLAVTMLLGGLWHGAAWTFVLWGAFHGALLAAHRFLLELRGEARPRARSHPGGVGRVVRVVVMFHVTCVGWLIFRAASTSQLLGMAGSIVADMHLPTQAQVVTILELGFYSALAMALQALALSRRGSGELGGLPPWVRYALPTVLFYATLLWGRFGEAPFIYFQF
jgi:D-alanyl-lipoteichoic acid acyltransferase DltB (MBOAT superfamily)